MLNKNDLYDISYALIIIRNNITNKLNPQILSQIIKVLEAEHDIGDNQIRKAISTVDGLDREFWFFAFHNNVYVNHQILNQIDIYVLLVKLFQSLIYELNRKEFEKAYDLADSFHCLPEIIADNNFRIPKSFWNVFLKDYRRKWDNNFLRDEERRVKRFQGII